MIYNTEIRSGIVFAKNDHLLEIITAENKIKDYISQKMPIKFDGNINNGEIDAQIAFDECSYELKNFYIFQHSDCKYNLKNVFHVLLKDILTLSFILQLVSMQKMQFGKKFEKFVKIFQTFFYGILLVNI